MRDLGDLTTGGVQRPAQTMIAMGIASIYDEYRRDAIAPAPVYPAPAHPVQRAMMRAFSMIGLGVGDVTEVDEDAAPSIG